MPDSRHCTMCGRPLRDPASRARGTGPVCHRKTRSAPSPRPASWTLPASLLRPIADVPTGLYL
ncbi:hypothetical protein JHN55_06920 [Streptomyces sp. MBT56]|uniref:DUF6011 domain-containing protein n=1 Tax=unclassified Streptomyces TaxID=2593676 RepID=UPI00190C5A66|nr:MULTISPECIES: DUF6011 domain-containing protein [unclassified Streptomyces]MBK3556270.1 hypothetical protein [Streptomyces sp. MBT56]MBK3601263.1 hypothetical protein [Streptomyces sp. MBT54]MBK3619293.1 hypothetical protein [Streptomyces sp. MBT98]MBK6046892.1 hypothetical protein [Streptomyces sp. MBT55]